MTDRATGIALPKKRIVLRELKETNFRLRVLREAGVLAQAHDPVIHESAELVKIVATLVRNESSKIRLGATR